jgi:hypothetical protein
MWQRYGETTIIIIIIIIFFFFFQFQGKPHSVKVLKIISFVISVVRNGTGTLTAFSYLTYNFVARVMVVVPNPHHFDYKSSFYNIFVSSNGRTFCHNYSQQRLEVIITQSVRPLFLFSVSPLDIFIHRSLSSDSPNFNNHRHTLNPLFQGLSGET